MAFMPWPPGYMFGPYHRKDYYEPSDLPPNWDEWRRLAYQRAGYQCQRCGAYGVHLSCFAYANGDHNDENGSNSNNNGNNDNNSDSDNDSQNDNYDHNNNDNENDSVFYGRIRLN